MAVIKSLIKDSSRNIPIRGETVADYSFYGDYFSIWSYKDGDMNRKGACSQNMQFNKEVAKVLRDALDLFLMDK